ncbi:hypothetical protein AOLI_G00121030 [Acnodon oligacanthus]
MALRLYCEEGPSKRINLSSDTSPTPKLQSASPSLISTMDSMKHLGNGTYEIDWQSSISNPASLDTSAFSLSYSLELFSSMSMTGSQTPTEAQMSRAEAESLHRSVCCSHLRYIQYCAAESAARG